MGHILSFVTHNPARTNIDKLTWDANWKQSKNKTIAVLKNLSV